MSCPPQYHAAERLEAQLGDPADPASEVGYARAVALDEADAFPSGACRAVDAWGMPAYYAPASAGGRLTSYEELLSLTRALARRDLTVAIGHGKTYLGAAAAWVAGTPAQQARVAAQVLAARPVSLALTERAHGSDLLASEVEATELPGGGFRLTGEKWLINNATRSSALTVFARTRARGGPRGFSCLWVEKDALGEGTYRHLPKVKTHGIRGADISGIRFEGALLPAEAALGGVGRGLEVTLKLLQITRMMCASLSLGAADAALRVTLDFALSRRLYGTDVFAIPLARESLALAAVDQLICECTAVSATRALHVAPEQLLLWSSVAKYFVPTVTELSVAELARVLGARHYLREAHHAGIFQKLLRDNALVGLFDGNAAVNLQALTQTLHERAQAEPAPLDAAAQERVRALFRLEAPLPAPELGRLDLSCRGEDDALAAVLAQPLAGWADAASTGQGAALHAQLARLRAAVADFDRQLRAVDAEQGADFSRAPAFFALARRLCALHAAACCVLTWVHNRDALGPFFAQGSWLVLALERLLGGGDGAFRPLPADAVEQVAQELARRHREAELFSLVPVRLYGGPAQILGSEPSR